MANIVAMPKAITRANFQDLGAKLARAKANLERFKSMAAQSADFVTEGGAVIVGSIHAGALSGMNDGKGHDLFGIPVEVLTSTALAVVGVSGIAGKWSKEAFLAGMGGYGVTLAEMARGAVIEMQKK